MDECLDVVIVGAGLSGIGAAYRLETECPSKSYTVLEGRSTLGGTWDLFRYPGVRADSDMFTLSYPFKPWTGEKSIADGPAILAYIADTAKEFGLDQHIRFEHRVTSADWDSDTGTWDLTVQVADGSLASLRCNFLYLCGGYYRYDGGYAPEFPGQESFLGPIVHPQAWPENLDYSNKRVAIIGSGATAVTLVPAMAEQARHVTMVQRSPSYITSLPSRDVVADALRGRLTEQRAHSIIRWKNVLFSAAFYQFCRRKPERAKKMIRAGVLKQLPEGFVVDPHFDPTYNPWDQRLCLTPDGDFFVPLASGRSSIVTGNIASIVRDGILMESGELVEADVIVTATGLQMVAAGGVDLSVDGQHVDLAQRLVYKGHMLGGVPNLAMCIGYINASWTLRADLTSMAVCRVLNYMDRIGVDQIMPSPATSTSERRPILDLSSGYIQRASDNLPKQGTKAPWYMRQNYILDACSAKFGNFTRGLTFSKSRNKRSMTAPKLPVGATKL